MNQLFKVISFFTTFTIIITNSTYSTETRMQSMGGVGLYTRDNSNIFHFPSTINSYANESIAELRAREDDTKYSIGLQTELGEKVFWVFI